MLRAGSASRILIDEAEEMPSSSAYAHRSGRLLRAYELVEYTPSRDMRYIEINRHIRSLYPDICENVIQRIQNLGGNVHREVETDMIFVNNEVQSLYRDFTMLQNTSWKQSLEGKAG